MATTKRRIAILHDPTLNKSTAFTETEKQALGIVGLVPDVVETEDVQLSRVLMQLGHKSTDLERYIYLVKLLDHNEVLFYRTVMSDPVRLLPYCLRPDNRRSMPQVRPHLPSDAWHVPVDHASGQSEGRLEELAAEGCSIHLCKGCRAHPRVG